MKENIMEERTLTLAKMLEKIGGREKIFLDNLTKTRKDRFYNEKKLAELTEHDQISIVSNAMFFTMLGSGERRIYICKLLADLFECDYRILYENSDYYKNEFDKDSIESKGERGDLIIKLGSDYICVEMNMKEESKRTMEYTDRVYRRSIKVGEEYIYPQVLAIDLNNFYYEELNRTVEKFWIQNDEGVAYANKAYIHVYLPLIYQKWYTKGIESLSVFEKTILTMLLTNRDEAKELAKGNEVMEEYVRDAKKVEKTDEFLGQAYDHELSMLEAEREEGYSEGRKAGQEEGYSVGHEEGYTKREKEIVQNMISQNYSFEDIGKVLGISFEEAKELIDKVRF